MPQKAETGWSKHSGYSDIDVLAIKPKEVLVIQAKTDVSVQQRKGEDVIKTAQRFAGWFDHAISAMRQSQMYGVWMKGSTVKKVLVADYYPKTGGFLDALKGEDIIFWHLPDILKELIELLNKEVEERGGHYGKQNDPLLRILMRLINLGFLTSKRSIPVPKIKHQNS